MSYPRVEPIFEIVLVSLESIYEHKIELKVDNEVQENEVAE